MKRTLSYLVLVPRNLCVAILRLYRAVISPLYGDVCRYYPSCSQYALQAIQHHGVTRGVWFGSRRLARCHPWAEGGIDDIPRPRHDHVAVSRWGFAVPAVSLSGATTPQTTSFASRHGKG